MHYASSWIELSRSAFDHNVSQYRAMLGPSVALTIVVKSNAYGHGLAQMAQLCQEHPAVDALNVVLLSDALLLRAQGITKPIIVLQSLDADIEQALRQSITISVHDRYHLALINAKARTINIPASVHIEVDTGLTRLGFMPAEIPALVQYITTELSHIRITGIWSHFAESDALDISYTTKQHQQFAQLLVSIAPMVPADLHIHLANSTGAARFTDKRFTMVRCAGGILGFAKSEQVQQEIRALYPNFSLQPLLTWKTRIMALKDVPADTFVGYARSYQTERVTRTAVVPVGYYDGYVRALSNKGSMLINGYLAPVIGRVSMTATVLDVTDIPSVAHDDEVIVMGPYAGVSVYDHAQLTDTIGYEVITRINPLLPRIIVN